LPKIDSGELNWYFHALASPNFEIDKSRDIFRPYKMGIRAYSKVSIKYFSPLVHDYITKIA